MALHLHSFLHVGQKCRLTECIDSLVSWLIGVLYQEDGRRMSDKEARSKRKSVYPASVIFRQHPPGSVNCSSQGQSITNPVH